MQRVILKAPFNSLSFGQVSYNLARALYEMGKDVSIFPYNESVDLSAYSPYMSEDFSKWLKSSMNNRFERIDKDTPCIHLWHIRGSELKITNRNFLFTFHELDSITEVEKTICSLHEKVFVSSLFSQKVFSKSGLNSEVVNIGFDKDIKKVSNRTLPDTIHFGLVGKWEKRKNTEKIIKTWLRIFGNNKKYRLTCLVENPFLKPEQMKGLIAKVFDGKDYWNVSFLPRLSTNLEVNDFYNSIDIDLSGLSSAEGWNLPAFNATCLGKWSCVSNCTAHTDWANKENSILVEPTGLVPPWDGVFFQNGAPFNQGNLFEIPESGMEEAMLKASCLAGTPNLNGESLREKFNYKNTAQKILEFVK